MSAPDLGGIFFAGGVMALVLTALVITFGWQIRRMVDMRTQIREEKRSLAAAKHEQRIADAYASTGMKRAPRSRFGPVMKWPTRYDPRSARGVNSGRAQTHFVEWAQELADDPKIADPSALIPMYRDEAS